MSDKHVPFGKPTHAAKEDVADEAQADKPAVAAKPAPAVRKVEPPKVALGDTVLYFGANGSDYHARVLEDHGNGELLVKVSQDAGETGHWNAVVNFAEKYTEGHWGELPKKEAK